MFKMLIGLMVIEALAEFGMTVSELRQCKTRECIQQVEKRSRDVLGINWNAISVFPEEAKKFM